MSVNHSKQSLESDSWGSKLCHAGDEVWVCGCVQGTSHIGGVVLHRRVSGQTLSSAAAVTTCESCLSGSHRVIRLQAQERQV